MNGFDLPAFEAYIEKARKDPRVAERNPTLKAVWRGGGASRIEENGNAVANVGGDGEPSAMKVLLGTLAACDVEVVATKAALLGVKVEQLEVEATGHFDVRRLLGLDGPPTGYDGITYTVRVKAPGATKEQLTALREACETASPVGATLASAVPLRLKFLTDE